MIAAAAELPILVAVVAIYFFTRSLSIADIAAYQEVHGPLLILAFPAAVAMYLVILSKMHYGPFSIIEAKEIVSGNMTEHFGVWRAGLEVAYALKTYVLLYAFVLIFIGSLPLWMTLLVMLLVLVSLSFVCAVTPMLSPYDTVTIQTMVTGALVIYIVILGVVMG